MNTRDVYPSGHMNDQARWWQHLKKEIADAESENYTHRMNAVADAVDIDPAQRVIVDAILAVESRLTWLGLVGIYQDASRSE